MNARDNGPGVAGTTAIRPIAAARRVPLDDVLPESDLSTVDRGSAFLPSRVRGEAAWVSVAELTIGRPPRAPRPE
jgi:hypothetical protein